MPGNGKKEWSRHVGHVRLRVMKMWQRILLVLLSAGLGILVFPPSGLWWLAVVAWIPLLLALPDAKPSHALYLGLLHGVVFYGVTMSWLLDVFSEHRYMFAPLVLMMALFTAVFARGYAVACGRYRAGWTAVVFAAVWWTAVEFFRSEIFYLKFPWMTPGLGLGPTWVSPLLGVSGAGFLTILGSAACAQWRIKSRLATGSFLLVVMLASSWWQTKKQVPQDTPVRVLAVQSESADLDHYAGMTRSAGGEHDLVIWPEHAMMFDVQRIPVAWERLKELSRETGALLVVGTRVEREDGKWYNTALTISPAGRVGAHYKNHPVHFFDDGEPGTGAEAVDTRIGKIGTSICFDNDYQDVARRMVADGAEFLAIPSMDAIHWGEKQHYQHAELFRHRAAENGRWMVVAATSGMTQAIDPNGNRVASIPIIDEGTLSVAIGRRKDLTPYTRFGWLFPWAALSAGILWVALLFVQGLMEKRRSRDTRIA